jgi:hypothetical protein
MFSRLFILGLLLLIALPAHAQERDDPAPGTTTQNISQTLDGVTVSILASYTDITQVAFWYEITGLDLPDGQLHGAPFLNVSVLGSNGDMLITGSSTGGIDMTDSNLIAGFHRADVDFTDTQAQELTIAIAITQPEGMPLYLAPAGVPIEEAVTDEYRYDLPYDLSFRLPITVTPIEGRALFPALSADSNGLNLAIEAIMMTPVRTAVRVCFDLPDANDWQPDLQVRLDGNAGQLSGFGLEHLPDPQDTRRCSNFAFVMPASESPESLEILVDGLVAAISDGDDTSTRNRIEATWAFSINLSEFTQ